MVKACEFCLAPKGASDVAAFGLRVCGPCLEERTISGYRLETDWQLPREQFQGLRHTTKSFWARRVGQYSLDFFLREDVLPVLVAYHVAADASWGAVQVARDLAAARARQGALDAAAEARRVAAEHLAAVKVALRARGVRLKDAAACPAYKALACGPAAGADAGAAGADADADADAFAGRVSAFLADQAEKATWLGQWAEAQVEADRAPASVAAAAWRADVCVDAPAARLGAEAWTERRRRERERIGVLERWLRARCYLPAEHGPTLAHGLELLRSNPPQWHTSRGSLFRAHIDQRLARAAIVSAEAHARGSSSVTGLSSSQRFTLHKELGEHHGGVTTYSTGPDNARVLHAFAPSFWEAVFPLLPQHIIKDNILARLDTARTAATAAAAAPPPPRAAGARRTRTYECCECGTHLHRSDALVSVHFRGIWCEECVEADEEMSGHKWEGLD
jgi:hypothetical protein